MQDSVIAAVTDSATAVLDQVYLGNSVRTWLVALAVFVGVTGALLLLRTVVVRRLAVLVSRTATHADDVVVAVVRRTRYFFILALGLAAASLSLDRPDQVREYVGLATRLAVLLQVGLWANEAIGLWIRRVVARKAATDLASVTTINALGILGRLVLWTLVFLMALKTFGIDVTALITGLGIVGIAVALAVQNVLGDLLASLSIVLDKPFVVGDTINVDTHTGTVEEIGLKTTRVRSLSGEQLVFPNADLLKSRIRNFRPMVERRVVLQFGVEYGTTADQMARIPGIVREIVEGVERTRFDRAHFFRFGPSSLDVEVVYFVLTPDYLAYMDIQQQINLELMRRLDTSGVAFAFPTQTVFVRNGPAEAALAAAAAAAAAAGATPHPAGRG
jgi:small-conductance mechanosensitive channel